MPDDAKMSQEEEPEDQEDNKKYRNKETKNDKTNCNTNCRIDINVYKVVFPNFWPLDAGIAQC